MSNNNDNPSEAPKGRRGSVTQQAFTNLFGRSNSTSGPTAPFPVPGPATTAAVPDQKRRMSINTLGLSGTSPNQPSPFPFGGRRGSVSTANSDAYDENAIDDDDTGRSAPTTPFTRRISFGAAAMRNARGSGSPGTSGEGNGFNWSEQLRSRAESQTQRASFSTANAPPKMSMPTNHHERARSISEMPAPPTAVPAPAPRPERKKPDAFQERILKGDFYMD